MYSPRDGLTRLIYRAKDEQACAPRKKECAARKAVARGLKEYLQQLHIEASGGRDVAFRQVIDIYGDMWTPAKLPAANVHGGSGDADYDSAKSSGGSAIYIERDGTPGPAMTTSTDAVGDPAPPLQRVAYFAPSSFEVELVVEVWAADEAQREAIDLMLEDDFNPTPDWMSGGFRLELPHYSNERADYHLRGSSVSYEQTGPKQGVYKSRYTFEAKLDLRVPRARPKLLTKIVTDAT